MKKYEHLAFVLAVAMIITLIPVMPYAESTFAESETIYIEEKSDAEVADETDTALINGDNSEFDTDIKISIEEDAISDNEPEETVDSSGVEIKENVNGYGRIADAEKLLEGKEEGIYGAWMLKGSGSSLAGYELVYLPRQGSMTRVIWNYTEMGDDARIVTGDWSYGDAIDSSGDKISRVLLYMFELTKGWPMCTVESVSVVNGHTVINDGEMIAITDEAFDELSKLKSYNWDSFDTYNIAVTNWQKKVSDLQQNSTKGIKDLPAAKILKPKAAKKSVTVKWKKLSKKNLKKVSGIQIQIATDSGFANIVKTATAGKKKTSKKISGLASKTKYWVRIRTYRNAADGKHVSAWKVKTVKIK